MISLRSEAFTAVITVLNEEGPGISDNALRVQAADLVRKATDRRLREIAPEIMWAIGKVRTVRLDQHLVSSKRGWTYRFPNGHEASVVNDPHAPFRFEVFSRSLNVPGDVIPGLTTEQVEAKLYAIAALPIR